MSEIQKLPELDQPSFFGLPDNIGRSWQRAASASVIDQLKGTFNRKYKMNL